MEPGGSILAVDTTAGPDPSSLTRIEEKKNMFARLLEQTMEDGSPLVSIARILTESTPQVPLLVNSNSHMVHSGLSPTFLAGLHASDFQRPK